MSDRKLGRPRRNAALGEHVSTTVRLPEAVRVRLDAECDRRLVGRNLVVVQAITDWLDRAEGALPASAEHFSSAVQETETP